MLNPPNQVIAIQDKKMVRVTTIRRIESRENTSIISEELWIHPEQADELVRQLKIASDLARRNQ